MRRLRRPALPSAAQQFLDDCRTESDATDVEIDRLWENCRRRAGMEPVTAKLREMTGSRERCVFCGDSRGATVDHFWPKAKYRSRTFNWPNLLLICGPCNSKKGSRFDLDEAGQPLLVDPSAEEPWAYLDYDPGTGMLTATYDTAGQASPKGAYTTDPRILPLNIEAVTEGRQRTFRALRRAAQTYLDSRQDAAALAELIGGFADHDDHGLHHWVLQHSGADEEPFAILRSDCPTAWQALLDRFGWHDDEE